MGPIRKKNYKDKKNTYKSGWVPLVGPCWMLQNINEESLGYIISYGDLMGAPSGGSRMHKKR